MLLSQVEIDNDLSYEVIFSEKQPITEKNPESPTKHSIHVIFPETNDVSALCTTIRIATKAYAPIIMLYYRDTSHLTMFNPGISNPERIVLIRKVIPTSSSVNP